jgi:hypothetical protein
MNRQAKKRGQGEQVMKTSLVVSVGLSIIFILGCVTAQAIPYGGVEFPDGASSFADAVVSYDFADSGLTDPHQHSENALGVPDYDGVNSCPSGEACSFASLGRGGSITLQFLDNFLTGSGDAEYDLWIFEVGPDVEDTFVEISKDNVEWFEVGKVFGATAGIDLDDFGFGLTDFFSFVRLTDDPLEGGLFGATSGADIDAVGAISSYAIPEPGTLILVGFGLLGIVGFRRTLKRKSLQP